MFVMSKRSYYSYVLLLAIIVATYIAGPLAARNEPGLRLIGWDLLVLWLLGFVALNFQQQAGFPEMDGKPVNRFYRIVLPVGIGILFGLADVVVFEVILQHPPYEKLPPFLQPFPYSLFLYTSGAVYVEILHRLLPLTLIMVLVHRFLPARHHVWIFWIFATLTSLWEPLEQMPTGQAWLMVYSFASGFAFNFLQAVFYKKAGWLASLFVRLGHYCCWHILLGIYVQFWIMG